MEDIRLIQCERAECKLTAQSCGHRYIKSALQGSSRSEETGPYLMCKGCPTGAANEHLVPANKRSLVRRAAHRASKTPKRFK